MSDEKVTERFVIELPCKIGDVIQYKDENYSFEFIVEQIIIDSDEIRICSKKGCVVYAKNFDKYCQRKS